MENTTANVATTITSEQFNEALATAEAALNTPGVIDYGDQIAKDNYMSGRNGGIIEGFLVGGLTVLTATAVIKLIKKVKAKKAETEENPDIVELKEDEE